MRLRSSGSTPSIRRFLDRRSVVQRLAARQVDVAYRSQGIAGVQSGINAGDLVVTSGQLKLYPSLRVTIVDDVPNLISTDSTDN